MNVLFSTHGDRVNILITGVAGFIGFSLAKYLLNHNNKIKIYGIDNLDDYYSKKIKYLRLAELKKSIQEKGENPFNTKKLLGKLIVSELYSDNEARSAETSFQNITINKNTPDDLQIFTIDKIDQVHLPKILTENGITKSNSEARRLIESGSFKINDEKYTELDVNIDKILNKTLQLGKRTFFTLN